LVKIHRCNIQGCWDPNYVAAQEGIAAIDVGYAAYTQIVTVEHCYFGGSGNGPRPVSWTSADRGTITVNMTAMCGNQYGVRVIQCEDFLFSNNYVGGNVYANLYGLLAPGSVNLDWRITGNFIDGTGATGTMIRIFNQQDGDFVTAMTIGNNVFNERDRLSEHHRGDRPGGEQLLHHGQHLFRDGRFRDDAVSLPGRHDQR
jgi:hypothetical protein